MIDNTPMMSKDEVKIIDDLLTDRKPKACLEWGSGGSSIYFPSKHDFIESWLSIEHNELYADFVKKSIPSKVALKVVRLEEYLSVVKGMKFDFILIDGLMRNECIMFAEELLNDNGFIIIHDSGRMEYQKVIKNWSGKKQMLAAGEVETKTFAHRGLHILTK